MPRQKAPSQIFSMLTNVRMLATSEQTTSVHCDCVKPSWMIMSFPQNPLSGGKPASDIAWNRNSRPSHGAVLQSPPV